MQNFDQILAAFPPISLQEMDRVALMDRMDSKYIFHVDDLEFFLNHLKNDYSVLNINGKQLFQYESLYFDTPNFDLYKSHHRGKLNRFKFRFRKYVESNLLFFEVKFKNNKGRTKKSRFLQENESFNLDNKTDEFLLANSLFQNKLLEEKIWVNYSRITLVNNKIAERVTLDLNLTFKSKDQELTLENMVVAEVKQDKVSTSPFVTLMHRFHVREGAISKYCLGICHLYKHLIFNNFKPFFNKIKKQNLNYVAS